MWKGSYGKLGDLFENYAFSSFWKHCNFPKQRKQFDDISWYTWYLSFKQIGNVGDFNESFIQWAFQILLYLSTSNTFSSQVLCPCCCLEHAGLSLCLSPPSSKTLLTGHILSEGFPASFCLKLHPSCWLGFSTLLITL